MNEKRTPRDVFVLSGGAARGAVQVGMMQTLIEAGIKPVGLVGTSVGALNAAFVGWHPDNDRVHDLAERWLRLTTRDIFPGGNWTRLAHLAQRHAYLFSSDALRSLVRAWIPTTRLEDLGTPVRVTTTPLASSAACYHDEGPIEQLLLASAAVPGVFAPVVLTDDQGRRTTHVDGGVADLVPVAGVKDFNPTRVFVLDATVPARLPHARTPIEIVVASLGVAMRVRPAPDLGEGVEVHHLTAPDLGTGMTDFSRTADHLALGRRVAAALVDGLDDTAAPGRRPRWRFGRAA
ncbi:NTE family protein [Marmoricola sp. OAE513]|uniref:patatin-like phospholipase family protein n=1 Tax=Marmoricola sp. OAE513 TaxID=2817894 RepID=UPI001AE3C937